MTQKIALLTFCTEYAGPASVTALEAEGFTLHCHDPKFADPRQRDLFRAAHPDAVIAEASEPEALVAEVLERHGRIDSLVSNDCAYTAGFDFDVEDFRKALEILTVVPYRLAMAAAPAMREQGGGSILMITSGGPLNNPILRLNGQVAINYLVAREGTNTLVRSLAVALAADQIQVNAIAPFMIYSQTYFPSEIGPDDPQYKPFVDEKVPMGRFGLDAEFAPLVVALASGRSRFISGQVVAFSGAGA